MPSTERSFYLLNTRTICVICLYNCMQCVDGFSILLQRYVTKGNDAKNPAIFSFCLLGSIRTSRQNHNCPWQNPRTNFVVTIFVSSVASALTWFESSNCVIGRQQACSKNSALFCNMWMAKLVIVRGDVTVPHRIRFII